jgi:hypothetical protein
VLACLSLCKVHSLFPTTAVRWLRVSGSRQRAADGAFLWCRYSNTALRSFLWFLGEVAFKLLLFIRAPSAPLCVVVACALVLMRVASTPPPPCCSFPLARATSPLHPQMQRGRCWRPVGAQHLCAVLPHRVCSLGLAYSAVRCCRQSARASALYLVCRRRWYSRRMSARGRYLVCLRWWCCFRLSARGSTRYLVTSISCVVCTGVVAI